MSSPPNQFNQVEHQALVAREADVKEQIAQCFSNGALYVHLDLTDASKNVSYLPETIELQCLDCGKTQIFERDDRVRGSGSDRGWGKSVNYQCRNCKKRNQKYMYVWNDNNFWKVGQIPELQDHVDPKLKKALGRSAPLYRKALRSRSFGFGIGAVSYLRRIVEDETDSLMDLLKDEKWDTWDETERAEFENARMTFQYSQKIDYAAEKILPSSVFANGRDSFSALHDVTSSGLHGKSEEDCIAIFDRCNLIFTRSFQMLSEHKRERDEFAARLLALRR
jgi:hypothetical protein